MKKKQIQHKQPQLKTAPDPKLLKKLKITLSIIIVLFAIILYTNSVNHSYTLDDHPVIDQNNVTTKGVAGIPTILKTDYWYGNGADELRGPVYRPTSLIVFAIVWQFSPNNPHAHHLINVLLYATSCLILFLVLCQVFKKYNVLFPFVCALLYTVHPIHTEVVNNIKSLDEILCFLFGIVSIGLMLKYTSSKSLLVFSLGGFSYFLALISKETGITFLVTIPLIIFFFTNTSRKKIVTISALLLVLTGIWLVLRMIIFKQLNQSSGVTNSVLNNTLNTAPNFISREATVFYILLRYVILLFFPHPLTSDYNFAQIKIQTVNDPAALAAIIFFLGLVIYSMINFKKKSIIVFGILFFLITVSPVSNFFFLSGSTMAERFMYMPSLGFCLILTYLLIKLTKAKSIESGFTNLSKFFSVNSRLFIFVFGITMLYSVKTFSRNEDWKDDLTIFGHDVHISENSATAHFIYGTSLLFDLYPTEKDDTKKDSILNLCIQEINTGIDIISAVSTYAPIYNFHLGTAYLYKRDYKNAMINFEIYRDKYIHPNIEVYNKLGTIYYNLNMYDKAIQAEDSVINYFPASSEAYFNKGLALAGKQEYVSATMQFQRAIELKPNSAELYYNRGIMFGNETKYKEALDDYNKSIELNQNYVEAYINRGNILNYEKEYDEAIRDFNKAIKLRPDFANAYLDRGVCFINQKRYNEAIEDFNKAIELNPNYAKAYYNRGISKFNSDDKETACSDFQKAAAFGFQPAMDFIKQYCH